MENKFGSLEVDVLKYVRKNGIYVLTDDYLPDWENNTKYVFGKETVKLLLGNIVKICKPIQVDIDIDPNFIEPKERDDSLTFKAYIVKITLSSGEVVNAFLKIKEKAEEIYNFNFDKNEVIDFSYNNEIKKGI